MRTMDLGAVRIEGAVVGVVVAAVVVANRGGWRRGAVTGAVCVRSRNRGGGERIGRAYGWREQNRVHVKIQVSVRNRAVGVAAKGEGRGEAGGAWEARGRRGTAYLAGRCSSCGRADVGGGGRRPLRRHRAPSPPTAPTLPFPCSRSPYLENGGPRLLSFPSLPFPPISPASLFSPLRPPSPLSRPPRPFWREMRFVRGAPP